MTDQKRWVKLQTTKIREAADLCNTIGEECMNCKTATRWVVRINVILDSPRLLV